MEVDDIQKLLGGYKPFQVVAYICLALLYMRGAWHVFSPMYLGFDPGHHCTLPANSTLNGSVPWLDTEEGEGRDKCNMYDPPGQVNQTVPCQHGWTYDFLPGETSFLAEWNLVCGQEYLVELSTTVYMVGTTCGALFLTPLSDRFGRKRMMLIFLWVQAALGFGLAWVNNFLLFMVIRFFIGLMNMSIALCVYVLMSESFPSTHRLLPAVSVQLFWAVGIMLLALFAYLVRDWRHLEMLISLPNLVSVAYVCLLSESIPWLVSRGRLDDAEAVIHRAAGMNKILLPVDIRQTLEAAARSLANSLGYFGVLFLTPTLAGDRFLNLFYSAAVEIPAYIIAFFANRLIGRRIPTCVFLLICAAGNIAAIFIPAISSDGDDLGQVKTAMVMVGKFGITGSYSTLYLYANEIFPTPVRNHALGMASFFENIGSIAAPLMVLAAKKLSSLPLALFAGLTLLGGLLVLILPETQNRPLPQSVEETQGWSRRVPNGKEKYGTQNPTFVTDLEHKDVRL